MKKGHIFFGFWVVVTGFLHSFIGAEYSSAASIFLFDFDNTIVETRREFSGAFQTAHKLYQIPIRSNVLQKLPKGPKIIEVSTAEYEEIRHHLGYDNHRPGTIGLKYKLEDGTVIEPANYMVQDPDTFKYFFSGRREKNEDGEIVKLNYLLEDFKRAERLVKENPNLTFKGPLWNHMVAILKNKNTAKFFGILSARGHSRNEWKEFFSYLIEKKYVDYMPNLDMMYSVSLPKYDKFEVKTDISSRKYQILTDLIYSFGHTEPTGHDERIVPDGKAKWNQKNNKGFYQSLIVGEDNPSTIQLIESLFRNQASRKVSPIKYVLLNAGYPVESLRTHRPRFSVFTASGNSRQASALETLGEPSGMTEEQAVALVGDPKDHEPIQSICEQRLWSTR